ncbi:MAG TPA: multifunctional CCA tRNA nucleotidyl transferase/2'3'-cyclic phosphodiesterase/2'nucleotidase/phosphatase [Steroidobacteraceae bacterium]|nr:multifunctional CCA tRNA nucleotidyl transferase/2'3'-cyclic phosphodiesterase/2'nucleotidase/phosphatase [Steroidobacteraceae bacterium]
MQVYLVGGAVRDELLGLTVRERDWVVVGATPGEMERAGYRAVGRDFPVFLHPESHEEYALARLERKIAPGYRGFAIETSPAVTLEEDLRRRDLTINAMARAADGTLIDPYGGQADLRNRLLRHVSAAFTEDPVRILRVARFAARFAGLGFAVAPETLALMRTMVDAGETAALVSERVWRELELALAAAHPERAFEVLRDCGALTGILPQLAQSPELPLGLAALRCAANGVENAAATPPRWAALLAGLPVADIEALGARLRVPNEHQQLALLAGRLRARLDGDGSPAGQMAAGPEGRLQVLELADAFRRPERFGQWLEVCSARSQAAGHDSAATARQVAQLRASLRAAASVQLSDAELKGRQGTEIAALLRTRRLASLAALS